MRTALVYIMVVETIGVVLLGFACVLMPRPALALSDNPAPQLVIEDITFQVQENQQGCPGPECQASATLSGTFFINASSPLSTLDLTIDGMPEGQDTWNNTSPFLTNHVCTPVYPINCTDILTPNPATQTVGATDFFYIPASGANGNRVFSAGTKYEVKLVATFQDGSNAVASASVMAVSASGMPANWYVLPLSLLVVSLAAVVLVVLLLRRRVASNSESVSASVKLT